MPTNHSSDLDAVVALAQAGDLGAYETLVRRFQAMAVHYAYGLLGDFHLAQDAAQNAFVAAYADLKKLQATAAFSTWFRRVLFTHCDRLTRGKRIPTVPLADAEWVPTDAIGPEEALLGKDNARSVRAATQALSDAERSVLALFYYSRYPEKRSRRSWPCPCRRSKTVCGRRATNSKKGYS